MAQGLDVFLAPASISPGAQWSPLTRTEATRSDVLILIDTPNSRRSSWVQQEAGMALASGSLVIPVSLDGEFDELPGWIAGVQGIRPMSGETEEHLFARIAEQVVNEFGSAWSILPQELKRPATIGSSIVRLILLDQFSGPEERIGAWSRQYNRYLRINYEDDAAIPTGVSQGASLTLTGYLVERLCAFRRTNTTVLAQFTQSAVGKAEAFILSCQDNKEGGFGRLASEYRTRGGRRLTLDIRHTCWAIRALVSIDCDRLGPQIDRGLKWLARRVRSRENSDLWCWTTAPLLSLLFDDRLEPFDRWRKERGSLIRSVQKDLEASFDESLASWVKGEQMPGWVATDNALYVLNCLKTTAYVSRTLERQSQFAIDRLLSRSQFSLLGDKPARGIGLFHIDQAEAGPTCELLYILKNRNAAVVAELAHFLLFHLASRTTMTESFSWHLSAALTMPEVCNTRLESAGV